MVHFANIWIYTHYILETTASPNRSSMQAICYKPIMQLFWYIKHFNSFIACALTSSFLFVIKHHPMTSPLTLLPLISSAFFLILHSPSPKIQLGFPNLKYFLYLLITLTLPLITSSFLCFMNCHICSLIFLILLTFFPNIVSCFPDISRYFLPHSSYTLLFSLNSMFPYSLKPYL